MYKCFQTYLFQAWYYARRDQTRQFYTSLNDLDLYSKSQAYQTMRMGAVIASTCYEITFVEVNYRKEMTTLSSCELGNTYLLSFCSSCDCA